MMQFKNQEELKKHVERLKAFYNEFYLFLVVQAFSLLVWLLSGGGYFWPIWMIVLWGTPLFFKASKLEVVDLSYYRLLCSLREHLPFLKKSWEKDKLNELKKNLTAVSKTETKAPTPKKAPVKKAESAVEKKAAPKKAAAKKTPAKKASPAKAAPKK